MKNKREWGLALLLTLGMVIVLVIHANLPVKAENRNLSKAVFYVA